MALTLPTVTQSSPQIKARGCKGHRVGGESFQGEANCDVPTSVLWALHPQVNLVMRGSEAQPYPSAQLLVATTPAEPIESQVRESDPFHSFWALPQGICDLSSSTQDRAPAPCMETHRLNHWTNREGPGESHSLAPGRTGTPSPTGNSRAIPRTSAQGHRGAHLV